MTIDEKRAMVDGLMKFCGTTVDRSAILSLFPVERLGPEVVRLGLMTSAKPHRPSARTVFNAMSSDAVRTLVVGLGLSVLGETIAHVLAAEIETDLNTGSVTR